MLSYALPETVDVVRNDLHRYFPCLLLLQSVGNFSAIANGSTASGSFFFWVLGCGWNKMAHRNEWAGFI